ncbi:MAG: ssuA4 [Actinomycetia bacterium]|nr:ssuA4 [Actinomycetes bacterium]
MELNRRARTTAVTALAITVIALLGTTAASAHTSAPAQSQGRTRITIMVGGINKIIYATATLAKQLGYYEKAGVDIFPLDSPAGVEEADALVAGQIDAAMGYYNHTIDLAGKGKATECVVQIGLTPGHAIVVPTNSPIKSLADLKGKVMGITGTGSSTDFEMQYLGLRNGIQPSQFTRLPVGAGQTFIAALQHGQIDGGITSQPTIATLVASGQAKILVDLQDNAQSKKAFGGTFPSTCIYMRTDYVNTHKASVQKFVNAIVWTLKWIHSHTAAQIAAKMPSDYAGNDATLYTNAWQQTLGFYSSDGIMPKDGPITQYKVLAAFEPDLPGKHVKLSATYTNAFALQADKTKPPKAK